MHLMVGLVLPLASLFGSVWTAFELQGKRIVGNDMTQDGRQVEARFTNHLQAQPDLQEVTRVLLGFFDGHFDQIEEVIEDGTRLGMPSFQKSAVFF